ncbi:hypothetical protein D3C85_908680 [compost metagenome]
MQELLVQSRNGYIQVFPAVPQSWANVSFKDLRTEGAFLVSAAKENGVPAKVKIYAEKGGVLRIKLPFKTYLAKDVPAGSVKMGDDGIAEIKLKAKQAVTFENGYE